MIYFLATWVPKTPRSKANLTRYILACRDAARYGRRLGPASPAQMCFAGSTNAVIRG